MKLSDVREVKESLEGEANRFLKQNWEILKIVKIQGNTEERIIYILGKN